MMHTDNSPRTNDPGSDGSRSSRFHLWPNRSLDERQLKILLAVSAFTTFVLLVRSTAIHHFPLVLGPAITISGLAFALWQHNRSAAATSETIEIDPERVRVTRRVRNRPLPPVTFHTSWVRLSLADDRHVSHRITLSESGRHCSIGDFLSPDERLDLARALDKALHTARRPRSAA